MDAVLRARHDLLMDEFPCRATELRLVHTQPGSQWTRSIDAYCTEPRAARFSTRLTDYRSCCATCTYFTPRAHDEKEAEPSAGPLVEERDSA